MDQVRRQEEGRGEISQLIGFRVGAEEYGVEILRVREIIRARDITRLPRAPRFVLGIINLRGDVIPVLSLGERFGLPHAERNADTRVVVVEIDGRLIGMMVDSVSAVMRIPTGQIDPPPPIVGGLSREYVKGVGKTEGRLVILIDTDRVLSVEEASELGGLEAEELAAPEPAQAP